MKLELTDTELMALGTLQITVNGRPFSFLPSAEDPQTHSDLSSERSLDISANGEEDDRMEDDEHVADTSDDGSDERTKEKTPDDNTAECAKQKIRRIKGEPITEDFTVHYARETMEFTGQYKKGERVGKWVGRRKGVPWKFTLDFEQMTATISCTTDADFYTGPFVIEEGNGIIFNGDWRSHNEDETIVWRNGREGAKTRLRSDDHDRDEFIGSDFSLLKFKEHFKTSGIKMSADSNNRGWMKLKNQKMIFGQYVLATTDYGKRIYSQDYILQATDGKYYNRAGEIVRVEKR